MYTQWSRTFCQSWPYGQKRNELMLPWPKKKNRDNWESWHRKDAVRWGPCALRHWIQSSMEAILACHPAVSTEWLAGWQFTVYYDVCVRPPLFDTTFNHERSVPNAQPLNAIFALRLWPSTSNSVLSTSWFSISFLARVVLFTRTRSAVLGAKLDKYTIVPEFEVSMANRNRA